MNEMIIRDFIINNGFKETTHNFFIKWIEKHQICIDMRDKKVKIEFEKLVYDFNMNEIIFPIEIITISKKHHYKVIKKIMEYVDKSWGLKHERI